MIKGKKKVLINKELILSKITPFDIYRLYQGPFSLNHVLVNKFRGEKTPSLIIGNKLRTSLTHKDFGDGSWKGDCFDFVQQIHNCDYDMALRIIDRDFNLGMGSEKLDKHVITWKSPQIIMKPPPLIQVIPRKLSKDEWSYWGCYHQGEEDIKREYIYTPKEIWRNKKKIWLGDLMTFCYYYPAIDRWKIYRPHAPKREGVDIPLHLWKWDTNVPFDHIEDLECIRNAKLGVLGKSKKDKMVLRKALELETVCNTQAEDPACMTKEALDIFDTCERKLAVTDNDKKGKEFSWWLTDNFGFRHCNVPDKEQLCTDFADMSCVYKSLAVVREHFKRKRFI